MSLPLDQDHGQAAERLRTFFWALAIGAVVVLPFEMVVFSYLSMTHRIDSELFFLPLLGIPLVCGFSVVGLIGARSHDADKWYFLGSVLLIVCVLASAIVVIE